MSYLLVVNSRMRNKDKVIIIQQYRYYNRALTKPGTWNIPEHPGTSRNIPEHSGTSRNRANYHKINEKKGNKKILILDKR